MLAFWNFITGSSKSVTKTKVKKASIQKSQNHHKDDLVRADPIAEYIRLIWDSGEKQPADVNFNGCNYLLCLDLMNSKN